MSKVADSLSFEVGCEVNNPRRKKCTNKIGNVCKRNTVAGLLSTDVLETQ